MGLLDTRGTEHGAKILIRGGVAGVVDFSRTPNPETSNIERAEGGGDRRGFRLSRGPSWARFRRSSRQRVSSLR